MSFQGDMTASQTFDVDLTSHAAAGAAVAPSSAFEVADFKIYKDAGTTQRTSTAGITIQSPFDTIVGCHVLTIDLSDNTDAGFYAAGSNYIIVLDPDETVDSQAVVRTWSFSIQNRYHV